MHHELETNDLAQSFVGVWKRVTGEPRAFFQEMPVSGGLPAPLAFLTLCLAVSAVGFLVFGPRGWTIRIVIEGVTRSFVYAAVLTVVARQLFAGVGDFEANYRVVAYASAPFVLYWIPGIGKLAVLYSLYLVIVGLERIHAFDSVKAVLTLLLAGGIVAVLARILGVGPAFAAFTGMPA